MYTSLVKVVDTIEQWFMDKHRQRQQMTADLDGAFPRSKPVYITTGTSSTNDSSRGRQSLKPSDALISFSQGRATSRKPSKKAQQKQHLKPTRQSSPQVTAPSRASTSTSVSNVGTVTSATSPTTAPSMRPTARPTHNTSAKGAGHKRKQGPEENANNKERRLKNKAKK